MKKLILLAVMLFWVAASVYLGGSPGEKIEAGDLEAKLKVVSDFLLSGNQPNRDAEKGFQCLIDAIVMALPKAGYSDSFNKKIIEAGKLFNKRGFLDPTGVKLINEAYASINAGRPFKMPEVIKHISDAVEYCKRLVDKSRLSLEMKRYDRLVKYLLKTACMVVVPIEKKHG